MLCVNFRLIFTRTLGKRGKKKKAEYVSWALCYLQITSHDSRTHDWQNCWLQLNVKIIKRKQRFSLWRNQQNGVGKFFPENPKVCVCVCDFVMLVLVMCFHLLEDKIYECAHKLLAFNHIVVERVSNFFSSPAISSASYSIFISQLSLALLYEWIFTYICVWWCLKGTITTVESFYAVSFHLIAQMEKILSPASASAFYFPRKRRKQRSIY